MIRKFFFLYREQILYLVCGVLTIVVNLFLYQRFPKTFWSCSREGSVLIANTAAFIGATLFAYCTNTILVFRSSFSLQNFLSFCSLRLCSLLIDNLGTVFLISRGQPDLLVKLIMNVLIVILNYLFSKFIIYRKK